MPTRKQKRLDRLGYSGGKQFKTTSNLDDSFSDPDNNSNPGASLDTEWVYPLKDDNNDKPSIRESNKNKRKDDPRVDSITTKALKEQ